MTFSRVFAAIPKPGRLEAWILVGLLLFWVVLGVDTLIRSAFLYRPMTDAQVFFRAGWAVWADVSVYSVTDDNGWPYVYPPTFAVLMLPFAYPPHGMDAPWFALPYPVSIVVLYVAEVLAFFWAVHIAASALERAFPNRGSVTADGSGLQWQPWWFLRVAPMLAYLPLAAIDIDRGQITSFILLSATGFAAFLAAGRSFLAGLVLSVGVTLKLYPLIALGLPILRRDFACIAGFLTGLFVFAGLVPLVALGIDGFLSEYATYVAVAAGMSATAGNSLGAVPANMALDAIGFGAVIYKTWAILTGARIAEFAPHWVIRVHLAVLVCAFGLFAAVSWRRAWKLVGPQPAGPAAILLSVALLCAIMAMAPPVAQLNYLMLGVFLHMAVIATVWDRRGAAVTPFWLYALGGFVWPAAMFNMGEDLGRAAWLTTGVYPVALSIGIGLALLAGQTGRSGRRAL
ncbi:MAG: glycosyltransferase family 87 protein [Oricola sp.]